MLFDLAFGPAPPRVADAFAFGFAFAADFAFGFGFAFAAVLARERSSWLGNQQQES